MYSDLKVSDGLVKSKVRLDLSWDLEPPLARPTQISDGAHWASPLVCKLAGGCKLAPPSLLQPYCMCAFMAHASSLVPAETCLQPAFLCVCVCGRNDLFGTRGASKCDAKSANTQGETRTSRSAPKLRMPGRKFLEHGLTENSIRTGPSEVRGPNTYSRYGTRTNIFVHPLQPPYPPHPPIMT
jgi:hypothetical protein